MKPLKMRMTNKSSLLLMTISLAFLSACTSVPIQAPVVDRTPLPPAPVAKPAPVEEPKDKEGSYTVRKGDTLSHIARRHGVRADALARANNIKHLDHIREGQTLRIPPHGFAA